MSEKLSPDLQREIGKSYLFSDKSDKNEKEYGLKLLIEACEKRDPEATFIVAKLIIDNVIKPSVTDPIEYALALMIISANKGCIQARAYLNAYCTERYSNTFEKSKDERVVCGQLTDFDGVPIRINRQGVFSPIDAILEYKNNCNILTLSANLLFMNGYSVKDSKAFEQAVIHGMMAWQGEYEVFGGQKLVVKVNITMKDNLFDNLYIVAVTDSVDSTIRTLNKVSVSKKQKDQINDMLTNKRSFATTGHLWSANTRKYIYVQSEDGMFDDYNEIMHVAKHEFGHALGLGDLYSSATDSLTGVVKGTYPELDSYAITDNYYNLVMCDHHGPISNNDIEMVVLAFKENRMQLYQIRSNFEKASSALGKGN